MALTYDQVTAITHDLIKEKLTAGVFSSNAFLMRLREKQVLEDGGNKILCPLMSVDDTGTQGAFYSKGDALSITGYDAVTASEHEYRLVYEPVRIDKIDIAKNAGRSGALKLIDSKVRQAEKAMMQRMVKGAVSDGGGSTGANDTDQFDGLDLVISTSATYGGIAVADLATWVGVVDDNSGTNRALTQALVDAAYDNASEPGIGAPTCAIMRKQVFSKFRGLLTGVQRTTRESSLSGLGHSGQSIVYNGIDFLVENNMPANTMFMVDEEHFKLHVHRDNNMRRESIENLETQDALLERIFLYGNVIASERRFNARINDITE